MHVDIEQEIDASCSKRYIYIILKNIGIVVNKQKLIDMLCFIKNVKMV